MRNGRTQIAVSMDTMKNVPHQGMSTPKIGVNCLPSCTACYAVVGEP